MDGGGPIAQLALGVGQSLSGRAWHWRSGDERAALALAQRLDVPEAVGRMLAVRGIAAEGAAHFLAPSLGALLPDPSVLTDMDAAAARMAEAARRRETVGIFGDYDVDGACATALLARYFQALGCAVITHIPDRLREGYGPNAAALTRLAAQGAALILCVDCGTAAGDVFAELQQGADIVVLDHHKANDPPRAVLATVNPNRLDCGSGLHQACATAIAFLAAVACNRALRRAGFFASGAEPDLRPALDLVALATVCDVMPLTGLNRALVAAGLKRIAARGRAGLAALLDVAGTKSAPDAVTCGYALGPRINAGGRISEADLGLRLLLAEDPLDARLLAERLDAANRQRQGVEARVLAEAMAQAEAQAAAGLPVLLVSGETWHPGVVGIVAGRLRERFNRPACAGGGADGVIKASGRSVPGIDLGAAVIAAREAGLLRSGGGHAMAAGFAYAPGEAAALHGFLCDRLDAARHLPAAAALGVEAAVSAAGATLDLARHIGRLAPFGMGNEEPLLAVPAVRVARADRIGRDGMTVRAIVEGEGGGRLKCLAFRAGDSPLGAALLERGSGRMHLAGHLRAESWNCVESVSFCVIDAAPA